MRTGGVLACGVVSEAADWNKEDVHGDLSSLGREICRALAAATLGRPGTTRIIAYPAEAEALAGLAAGQVDVVAGVTPSPEAARRSSVAFGPAILRDNQTFLVHRALQAGGAAGLAGKTVCFIEGTPSEDTLLAAMQARHIGIIPFPFQEEGEMDAALAGGHCRAISAYASHLAQARSAFHAMAADFVLLPERLAVSAAAIATRSDDPAWSAIAASVILVLTGSKPATGAPPMPQGWEAELIATTGTYAQIFERTLGAGSAMHLDPRVSFPCPLSDVSCLPNAK